MSTRTLYLVSFRNNSNQRAHFSIFVPSAQQPEKGTLIHVVGAPMAGYRLEFKRNYIPGNSQQLKDYVPIGSVFAGNIVDSSPTAAATIDTTARGNLELVAEQVRPPPISENFRAPVNGTTNKRCQEWTMEYVQRLVKVNYLNAAAIDIVQSKRDPPEFGIGLNPVGRGRGGGRGRGYGEAGPAGPAAPAQQATAPGGWILDTQYNRWKRPDGNGGWIWQ